MSPAQLLDQNEDSSSRKIVREKRLMDSMTQVADGNDSDRINAANDIVKLLIAKQDEIDEVSKELEYCLTRLIRGLASSKSRARLGFSLALIKILKHFDFVQASQIHDVASKVLTVQKTDSKADKSNMKLGLIMVHIALIQSGKLSNKSTKGADVQKTIEFLMKCKEEKKPLHQICTQALCNLMSNITLDSYKENLRKPLEKHLGSCLETADGALLLLTLKQQKSKMVTADFLQKHWNSSSMVSKNNIDAITKLYISSTLDHPVIHPFCYLMLSMVFKEKIKVVSMFWNKVVNEGLLKESIYRKHLAIQLIQFALKSNPSPEQIKVLLSKPLVSYALSVLGNTQHGLHSSTLEFVKLLQSLVAGDTYKSSQKRQLIMSILSVSRHSASEMNAVQLFTGLIAKMDSETMVYISKIFIDSFYDNENDVVESDSADSPQQSLNNLSKEWIVHQLCYMSTCHIGEDSLVEWRLGLLNFFFINSYVNITNLNKSVLYCDCAMITSDSLRENMRLGLMKSLSKLATVNNDKMHSKSHESYIILLQGIFNYAQELFSKPEICTPLDMFNEDARQAWDKIGVVLKSISSKKSMVEQQAFQLLFLHLGLNLFSDHSDDSIDLLKDLHSCYDKAFTTKSKSEKEPCWVSVLVELLLSMLSQPNKLSRVIANITFRMLCPNINAESMQLILDVSADGGRFTGSNQGYRQWCMLCSMLLRDGRSLEYNPNKTTPNKALGVVTV